VILLKKPLVSLGLQMYSKGEIGSVDGDFIALVIEDPEGKGKEDNYGY